MRRMELMPTHMSPDIARIASSYVRRPWLEVPHLGGRVTRRYRAKSSALDSECEDDIKRLSAPLQVRGTLSQTWSTRDI
jgi:hypothetical protein